MKLLQLLKTNYSRVYDDISTMPILNWAKIIEDKEITFLYIDSNLHKKKTKAKERKYLFKCFDELHDQYIEKFEMDPEKLIKLEQKRRAVLQKIDAYLDTDKTKRIFAKANEESLKGQNNPNKSVTFIESIAFLEKKLGQIDPAKMSVESYYTHCKLLNIELEAQKKQQAKWQKIK